MDKLFDLTMRSLLLAYSLSFIAFCTLFSCHGDMGEELFAGMDSLLEWHTDSAYKKLQAMKPTIDSIDDKRVSMKYFLLCTCAENKLDMQLPPDTVLAEVTRYFDEYGTPNERMMATYLRASACRDRKEVPDAVKLFKEAASCADTLSSDCDYLTLSHVYGQMADLLYYQILPDYSIESYKKSAHYALLAGDHYGFAREVLLQVQPLAQLEDTAAVLEITDSAYNLFMEYGMPQSAASVFPTAIDMYLGRKDYAKAKELMEIFDRESGLYDENGEVEKGYRKIHFAKGVIALNDDSLKAAEWHFRKLVSYGIEPYGYAGLGALFTRLGQTDSIMKYTNLRDRALDSLAVGYSGQSAAQAYVMYDQDKTNALESERDEAMGKSKRNIIIFIVLLIVILIFSYIVTRKILKRMKINKKFYDEQINDKERQLTELKIGAEVRDAYNDMQKSMTIKKMYDKSYNLKKDISFTDYEINKLSEETISFMPKFHYYLSCVCGLSRREIAFVVLVVMGFSNKQLAYIFNFITSYVSRYKANLNEKLFNENTSTTFYDNLKNMIDSGNYPAKLHS